MTVLKLTLSLLGLANLLALGVYVCLAVWFWHNAETVTVHDLETLIMQIKTRRHHNNTGYRQIKRGKTREQVERIWTRFKEWKKSKAGNAERR